MVALQTVELEPRGQGYVRRLAGDVTEGVVYDIDDATKAVMRDGVTHLFYRRFHGGYDRQTVSGRSLGFIFEQLETLDEFLGADAPTLVPA